MVEHIVLFKFKADASTEAVRHIQERLASLKSQIPGIVDLTVGENFCERNQGFTHGIVVRFDNRASLEAYLPHPSHQAVVQETIRPILEDLISVDYEIGDRD